MGNNRGKKTVYILTRNGGGMEVYRNMSRLGDAIGVSAGYLRKHKSVMKRGGVELWKYLSSEGDLVEECYEVK